MTHHYNIWLLLLSIAVAWLASYAMLEVAITIRGMKRRSFYYWLTGGSAVLGFGVWSTHFIGMLAHNTPIPLAYDATLTLVSILPAVASAALALSLFQRRIGNCRVIFVGGLAIGTGIATMHYIGMAALMISPAIEYDPFLYSLSWAIAIGASTAGLALGQRIRTREPRLLSKLMAAAGLGIALVCMHYTAMAAAKFSPLSASRALMEGWDTAALAAGLGVVTLLIIVLLIVISEARLILERSLARELEQMALHDQLTGLANRTLFHEQLCMAVQRGLRRDETFAVLAIDLDRFKEINDQFGHGVGDKLLRDVSNRLRAAVREEDLVGRLSGDEFSVLTAAVQAPDQVVLMVDRLLDGLGQPDGNSGIAIRASVGVALFPQDGETADDLLGRADFALYHAKATGRGHYHFYDSTAELKVKAQQQRLAELRAAIAQNELVLLYQPQVNLTTGALVAVEALLRWRHPVEGLLAPGAFIPLAESVGMMPSIDSWVLHHACVEASRWSVENAPLRVGVNISAQSIDDDLLSVAASALRESGLDPAALELEITETSFLTAGENKAFHVLSQLSDLGIQLSIDDFGTGYGSLVYLDSMPINAIKIDRQFVQAAPTKKQAAAIVDSLITLGRALGVRVVGEGVETAVHRKFLLQHGCEMAQGFLFSRPIAGTEIVAFVEANAPVVAPERAVGGRTL